MVTIRLTMSWANADIEQRDFDTAWTSGVSFCERHSLYISQIPPALAPLMLALSREDREITHADVVAMLTHDEPQVRRLGLRLLPQYPPTEADPAIGDTEPLP